MRIAVYPGSFDPITNGHMDIIERASVIFDKIIVGVGSNSCKTYKKALRDRVEVVKHATCRMGNVEVKGYSGLLTDFVVEQDARVILRGLRTAGDFEYENRLKNVVSHLNSNLEIMYMIADPRYSFISSSLVRELSDLHADVSDLLPPEICPERA